MLTLPNRCAGHQAFDSELWIDTLAQRTRARPHAMLTMLVAAMLLALLGRSVTLGANAALKYLGDVQDRFHRSYIVYEDTGSAGNHFLAWAKIPQNGAVTINGGSTIRPHRGATAIKATFTNTLESNWGGFYFLNGVLQDAATTPSPNFGTEPNAGIDLRGATALSFWARGQSGGEQIEFFVGGVGINPANGSPLESVTYPESFTRTSLNPTIVTLTNDWQHFRIPIDHRNLSYVLGGMGWVAKDVCNPDGATFFLDSIEFELNPSAQAERLQEPRFLRSFETLPIQPDPHDDNTLDDIHLVLRNAASAYDNAVAGLAFLAEGSIENQRRARLIADAFVHATTHDRFFNDGRVRSFYAAGDIALPPGWTPNGRSGTTPTPGFYDEREQLFKEIEQSASDTGNNAWTMIFLLHAFRELEDPVYLDAAIRIGSWIRTYRDDQGQYQGFLGGVNDPETDLPDDRKWASTEHNIDVIVASRLAYEITGETQWLEDARHAAEFVNQMFDPRIGVYRTGTKEDDTRNEDVNPSDVNTWAILADPATLQRHPDLLDNVLHRFGTRDAGFAGIDFNDDRDGVQFEMTAHLVLALRMAGRHIEAEFLLNELNRAQSEAPMDHPGAIAAATRDGLSTGFDTADGQPFLYFDVEHVGATAWLALAQLGVNPYTLRASAFVPGDYNGDSVVDAADYVVWRRTFGSTVDLLGDGNGDFMVDTADYVIWRKHFGEPLSRGAAVTTSLSSNVPEPSVAVILLMGLLRFGLRRRAIALHRTRIGSKRIGSAANVEWRNRRSINCLAAQT